MLPKLAVILEKSGSDLLPGLTPLRAESQSQHELPVAGREVNLPRAGEVAVLRTLVFPLHPEVI
jgi:hypothetical protein